MEPAFGKWCLAVLRAPASPSQDGIKVRLRRKAFKVRKAGVQLKLTIGTGHTSRTLVVSAFRPPVQQFSTTAALRRLLSNVLESWQFCRRYPVSDLTVDPLRR